MLGFGKGLVKLEEWIFKDETKDWSGVLDQYSDWYELGDSGKDGM